MNLNFRKQNIGYTLVSHQIVPNLKGDMNELGIQIKLGLGTPDERLNQANRRSQICFVKLCEYNCVTAYREETQFRYCFQDLFHLESRENSNEEYFVSKDKLLQINIEHHLVELTETENDINLFHCIVRCMIEKTLLEYTEKSKSNFQQVTVSRKRGRKPDDEEFIINCGKFSKFFLENKCKPKSKNHQMITNRLNINEDEAKLCNWYSNTKQNVSKLSSIRKMKFDEMVESLHNIR